MVVYRDENTCENKQHNGRVDQKPKSLSGLKLQEQVRCKENVDHLESGESRARQQLNVRGGSTPLKDFGPSVLQWASRERAFRQIAGSEDASALSHQVAAGQKHGTRQRGRRHFSRGKEPLLQVGSEDVGSLLADRKSNESKSQRASYLATPDFNSGVRSSTPSRRNGESLWADTLRESPSVGPWKPIMTVPQEPKFRTSSRSRSNSVRSCSPCCGTPESTGTPRGRNASWQRSLRGHSEDALGYNHHSVDCTPQQKKKKRRSLSTWWSEIEPHRRNKVSTPEIRSLSLGDGEDEMSFRSAASPLRSTSLSAQLSSMSRTSKRLTVERKRRELNQMVGDSLPCEPSVILEPRPSCPPIRVDGLGSLGSGSQCWLRSLRQGKACPPSAEGATNDDISATRTRSHSSQRVLEDRCMTPRERKAIEKHMERTAARSCSTQRSRSATPDQVQRSRSATPVRGQPLLQRSQSTSSIAEKLSSPGCHASRTKDQYTRRDDNSSQCSRSTSTDPCTRLSARGGFAKPSNSAALNLSNRQSKQSRGNRERLAIAKEHCPNEEWIRQAANPQERAERRRDMARSKFDEALANEKTRVCIFRRTSGTQSTGSCRTPVGYGKIEV